MLISYTIKQWASTAID